MSDIVEEAKAYIGFPRLGTRSVPAVNIIKRLITEVARLRQKEIELGKIMGCHIDHQVEQQKEIKSLELQLATGEK